MTFLDAFTEIIWHFAYFRPTLAPNAFCTRQGGGILINFEQRRLKYKLYTRNSIKREFNVLLWQVIKTALPFYRLDLKGKPICQMSFSVDAFPLVLCAICVVIWRIARMGMVVTLTAVGLRAEYASHYTYIQENPRSRFWSLLHCWFRVWVFPFSLRYFLPRLFPPPSLSISSTHLGYSLYISLSFYLFPFFLHLLF